jgi:hypothetical protein
MASDWRNVVVGLEFRVVIVVVVEGLGFRIVEEGVIGVSRFVGATGGGIPMNDDRCVSSQELSSLFA